MCSFYLKQIILWRPQSDPVYYRRLLLHSSNMLTLWGLHESENIYKNYINILIVTAKHSNNHQCFISQQKENYVWSYDLVFHFEQLHIFEINKTRCDKSRAENVETFCVSSCENSDATVHMSLLIKVCWRSRCDVDEVISHDLFKSILF